MAFIARSAVMRKGDVPSDPRRNRAAWQEQGESREYEECANSFTGTIEKVVVELKDGAGQASRSER